MGSDERLALLGLALILSLMLLIAETKDKIPRIHMNPDGSWWAEDAHGQVGYSSQWEKE